MHDRKEVKRELMGVMMQQGRFALLLGGKNVGKSLLLKDLSRASGSIIGMNGTRRAVLNIDARTCGTNLSKGLVFALSEEKLEQERAGVWLGPRRPLERRKPGYQRFFADLWARVPTLKKLAAELPIEVWGLKGSAEFEFSKRLFDPHASNTALLDEVLTIVDSNKMNLCLVIDEGNLALPMPLLPGSAALALPDESERELKATQALLNRFVQLTKQSRRINVLLAVSEYGYPPPTGRRLLQLLQLY